MKTNSNFISRPYLLLVVFYILFLVGIVVMASFGIQCRLFAVAANIPFGDKFGHLALMGIFSFLLNSSLYCRGISVGRINILTGSLIAYVIVFTEELSQHWVASRNLEAYDLLFDFIGIYLFGRLAAYNQKT